MAISISPFAVDVKAFSEAYGEFSHSVNANAEAETKLKVFQRRPSRGSPDSADCAGRRADAIFAG